MLCGESIIMFGEIKTVREGVVVASLRVQFWKWFEGNEEKN